MHRPLPRAVLIAHALLFCAVPTAFADSQAANPAATRTSAFSAERLARIEAGELHSKDGLGFGFGFQTVERYGANGMDAVGAYGWGGAYGSSYRVDPRAGVVILLMIQLMPNHTDVREKFANLVYQAML